jgi:hypothetical protein
VEIRFEGFGYDGENNSRLIEIFIDEKLRSKRIWLEFKKPRGEKKVSIELSDQINDEGIIEYYLKGDLLDEIGYLKMQVVASDFDYVKKSKVYDYYISMSINATEQIAEETPSIFNALGVISVSGDGTKYLSDDGTYKTVSSSEEINVSDFQACLEHISGYVIGKQCTSINEVLKEINKFYEKAKIVINAVDSVSGESISASGTVMGATKEEDGYYYLIADGTTWTMMVTCTGYVTQRIEFVVTDEDAKAGIKEFNISMVART